MLLLASAVISVLMHQFDDAISITVVRGHPRSLARGNTTSPLLFDVCARRRLRSVWLSPPGSYMSLRSFFLLTGHYHRCDSGLRPGEWISAPVLDDVQCSDDVF